MTTETTTVTRAELHALVDALPEGELGEAKRCLMGLNTADDPVLRAALLAPLEDEELSDEEVAALAEIDERRARGNDHYVSNEDVRRVIFAFDPPGFITVHAVLPRKDAYRD